MSLVTNSFFSYSQNKASGMSNTLFSFSFPGGGKADMDNPAQLRVPWRDLQDDIGDNPLPLLEWQTRCSRFGGRDEEMKSLRAWAESKPKVSIKFICGPGGVGKSRLAGEFADSLDTEGWNAGFIKLGHSAAYTPGKVGTLIVIDYPEERQDLLLGLLGSLASAGLKDRLRLLLLTRSTVQEWEGIIKDAHARALVNWTPVQLEKLPVSGDAAYNIFASAQETAAENQDSIPTALAEEELRRWMAGRKENALPLFLVAAGVYRALHPEAEDVSFTGPEVMTALVEREDLRLSGMSTGAGLPPNALSLVVTFATLCKGVPLSELKSEEAKDFRKWLGLEDGKLWADLLTKSGHVQDGVLKNLEPDIVGADFVHSTLAANEDKAPQLVFLAAARAPIAAIGTFGRLIYDAQSTLGRPTPHIHNWLLQHLQANPAHCKALSAWASYPYPLPHSLNACCAFIGECALTEEMTDEDRARELNNRASHLGELGQHEQALFASLKAVELLHGLSQKDPTEFMLAYANNLGTLSNCLSKLGQDENALYAIHKAEGLFRELAKRSPKEHEPRWAKSLNTLSCRLSEMGLHEQALVAIQEAITIRRRLAKQNSTAFEPDLSSSLNNISNVLIKLGQREQALEASQEAVALRCRLAEQNPAAFEPQLAQSLNNNSSVLSILGQLDQALQASQKAVELYRKLAAQNPAAFEPGLAMSLGSMTQILNGLSENERALAAIEEASALFRKYAKHNFLGVGQYVARALRDKADTLTALNRPDEAAAAQAEREDVLRRLKEARKQAEASRKGGEG